MVELINRYIQSNWKPNEQKNLLSIFLLLALDLKMWPPMQICTHSFLRFVYYLLSYGVYERGYNISSGTQLK